MGQASRGKRKKQVKREKVERCIWTRIDRDGKPVFEVVYRDSDGRQHRQRVAGGIMAARAVRSDVEARKNRGEHFAPNPRLTFGQAAQQWWEAQAQQLRPATRAAYRHALDDHLLPAWGKRRMDTLTVGEVASLVGRMQTVEYRREVESRLERPTRKVSEGYRAWTIRGALTVAGRVFEYAHRRMGWGGANPVRKLDRSERPSGDQPERRVLTREELTRLLDAADDQHWPLFAFAAGAGMRLGEALALRWRDLDLDAGTVSVTHQLSRPRANDERREPPERVRLKTARARRVVDLPASLVAALREHRLASTGSRPGDYVFVSRSGQPFDQGNVRRALAAAVRRADLDESDGKVTFHGFRHSYASAAIADGDDPVELSRTLGHRDPSITMSTYSHEFERASRSEERRARLDLRYGSSLAARNRSEPQQTPDSRPAEVVDLQAKATDGKRRK